MILVFNWLIVSLKLTSNNKNNSLRNIFSFLTFSTKRRKEKFKVYIVLPLLPGFDSQNAIQAVQYYNLRSINTGEYSIYKSLINAGIKVCENLM